MRVIDTHAHLFAVEYEKDINDVIIRAKNERVKIVLLPNIDETTINALKKCVSIDPFFFRPMMGLHPTSVTSDWRKQLEIIYSEILNSKYIAIGEIGLDLYWDNALQIEQINSFEQQLKWSIEMDLPVSIHFRNALEEVIKSIKRVGEKSIRGVFHSFGGNKDELNAILKLSNFMVGINGVITFKNSGLADTISHCPVNKVVLETDSPYLAPVPFRGKRNESSYIKEIVKKLSEIWQKSEEEVENITSNNAENIFRLDCQ